MLLIRSYRNDDEKDVMQLWAECRLIRSHNHPRRDIERKCAFQKELLLVGTLEGRLVATVMAGYEGHRGWLNYLAVAPTCRLRGYARRMVAEAEKRLILLGCPKINVQVRTANVETLDFYRKIGFQEDAVVSLGKRLS